MASSAGPNSGGTFADDSSVGTLAWADTGNAAANDGSYSKAINPGSSSKTTHYLKATNFGFSIPSEATIVGIKVEFERKEQSSDHNIQDSSIRLVKGGVISGSDLQTDTEWPVTEAYAAYGSSETELWGLTWTPADINSSSFGVAISAYIYHWTGQAWIDHIRITVYYTVAWTKSLSDSLSLSDSIVKSVGPVKADSLSLSDTIAKTPGPVKADSLSLSDTIVKSVKPVKADSLSLSDVFSRVVSYIRGLSDALSLSDSISKSSRLSKSDSLSLSDSIIKSIKPVKADTLSLSDSMNSMIVGSKDIALGDSLLTITKTLNSLATLIYEAPSLITVTQNKFSRIDLQV